MPLRDFFVVPNVQMIAKVFVIKSYGGWKVSSSFVMIVCLLRFFYYSQRQIDTTKWKIKTPSLLQKEAPVFYLECDVYYSLIFRIGIQSTQS